MTSVYPSFGAFLSNGFAQMEVWEDVVGTRIFYRGQILKYLDCLYRHRSSFKFGFFLDYDDYFVPILPDEKKVGFYFSKFFSADNVGSVCLPWLQMECAPIPELIRSAPHGNLTHVLSGYRARWRKEKKCAHRLDAVQLLAVHNVRKLLPGYVPAFPESKQVAYIAHNRYTAKPCQLLK